MEVDRPGQRPLHLAPLTGDETSTERLHLEDDESVGAIPPHVLRFITARAVDGSDTVAKFIAQQHLYHPLQPVRVEIVPFEHGLSLRQGTDSIAQTRPVVVFGRRNWW